MPPNCPYPLIEVNIYSKFDPAAPVPAMKMLSEKTTLVKMPKFLSKIIILV